MCLPCRHVLCEEHFLELGGVLGSSSGGSSSGSSCEEVRTGTATEAHGVTVFLCRFEMVLEGGVRQMCSADVPIGATASVLRQRAAELYSERCGGFVDSSRVTLFAAGAPIEDTRGVLAQDLHEIRAVLNDAGEDWRPLLDALPHALAGCLANLASRHLDGVQTWGQASEFQVLVTSICSLCRHEATRGASSASDEVANEIVEFLEGAACEPDPTPRSVLALLGEEFY